jgi:hypothetical protein
MGLSAYRLRGTFRRHRSSYAGIALLLGLTGGLSLASIAGARRTQSAYPRFLRSANASTIGVSGATYDPSVNDAVAAFPEVVQSRTYVSFSSWVMVAGRPDFTQDAEPVGTLDGLYFDQDRFAPTEGRLPDPRKADEVAVNEHAAERWGYHIGQRLELGIYAQDRPILFADRPAPDIRRTVTIVGIGVFPDEVLQDDGDRSTRMLLTPAYTEWAKAYVTYGLQGLVLAHGDADVDAVKQRYSHLVAPATGFFRVTSVDEFHALQAVQPLSTALALFGLVTGVAGLALVAQALSRALRGERDERAVLRAFGAAPGALVRSAVAGPFAAIAGGAALAVALAVAASPAMPIGPLRAVEVARGIDVDATVMSVGVLLIVVVLAAWTVGAAWHDLPHRNVDGRGLPARPSKIVTAATWTGMTPAAVTGLRLALERGDGSTTVPLTSALPGGVIAIVALVASITFGASLGALVDHPRLYGWNWDATVLDGNGYGNFDLDGASGVLDGDPHVARWSGAHFGSDTIDGQDVPLLGMNPGSAVVPPLLAGRSIAGPTETVLGSATAAQLHKGIGDTVNLAGRGSQHVVTVVGITTLPTVGRVHVAHISLGVGAIVVPQLVPGFDRDITNTRTGTFGPNALFVQFEPGTDATAEMARLRETLAPTADGAGVVVLPPQRPAEIVNSSSVGRAPALLAGALALGATVSLGLALGTLVRRRRHDLAVLKALGFTRRQLAATVAWQATATIVASLLLGVPLGVAFGRELWIRFAHRLDVVPEASIPWLVLAAITAGAVVLANAVAAVPAIAARRVDPAVLLRAE